MEKESIVVDANILISALIGGENQRILFSNNYEFLTAEFTILEVEKYLSLVSKKTGFSEDEIRFALRLFPIQIFNNTFYSKFISKAKELIEKIDPKNVDILALTLATGYRLWSNDAHFEGIKEIQLLKTGDLI